MIQSCKSNTLWQAALELHRIGTSRERVAFKQSAKLMAQAINYVNRI